jgi:hypothetical protein
MSEERVKRSFCPQLRQVAVNEEAVAEDWLMVDRDR